MNFKRKILEILQYELSIYTLFCCAPIAFALSINHSKTINAMSLFRQNANLFIRKLPAVWYVTLATHMRFIPIENINFPFYAKFLKFFKSFYLKGIVFWQWFTFTSESYSFISSAKLFKKARNVFRHTVLPLCDSHSALAVCMRCLFSFIAFKMDSLSSVIEMIGLRPRPDCVCNPFIPFLTKRLVQLFTLMWHMPVISPTSFEVLPSDFSNMAWQRIRKQWLTPVLKPDSNSIRCSGVNVGVFTRPIIGQS